ncbi:hypothetical protein BKA56DRAFT_581597 [Ilyonectria sp. MPI-CAGE-AT-0026]|nr:hypothetical protein BKA56DRAFT_581597 [Ilyonectria sp. MPI-CAGE-AT-0026]
MPCLRPASGTLITIFVLKTFCWRCAPSTASANASSLQRESNASHHPLPNPPARDCDLRPPSCTPPQGDDYPPHALKLINKSTSAKIREKSQKQGE